MTNRTDDTDSRILDVALDLLQRRGYGGFSYRDIAAQIGIRAASIHYHFPSKEDLGVALIERYLQATQAHLAELEALPLDGYSLLQRYVILFGNVLRDEAKLCPCAMLGAESDLIPESLRRQADRFFKINRDWLVRIILRGRADGSLNGQGEPAELATWLLAGLEGALVMARAESDVAPFDQTAAVSLKFLKNQSNS